MNIDGLYWFFGEQLDAPRKKSEKSSIRAVYTIYVTFRQIPF